MTTAKHGQTRPALPGLDVRPRSAQARGATAMREAVANEFSAHYLTKLALEAVCAGNSQRYEAFLAQRSLQLGYCDLMTLTVLHCIR
jgi:hypothetical protein